jgi:predicted amino acid-binding ACT domain protein
MNKYSTSDKELTLKKIEQEIKNKEFTLTLLEDIKKIVKKYDNKVYSKRLKTELKKLNECIYVRVEYNSFDITYRNFNERYVKASNQSGYILNDSVYIISLCKQLNNDNSTYKALDNEYKIIANNLIENIENNKTHILNSINGINESLLKLNDLELEYRNIVKSIKAFNDSVDYTVKEYFGLNIIAELSRYE